MASLRCPATLLPRSCNVSWKLATNPVDGVATGSQLLEQLAGLGPEVAGRAFQIREALFQDRRFWRVGLANLLDDLRKRHGFTAQGHALGVVVQNHLGPLQAALRLDLDRPASRAAAPKAGEGQDDHPNPEPTSNHVRPSSGNPSARTTKG